ncbi:LysR family transcriptional regulator [Azotobacter salinestris]|uniref:LysR family transcriptional regulator n=1 Tax=Azotobacter salinestris TaxID=69964 RepID=UPI0012669A21|nr:LysR family transcriptional regulator [Azotobacter salinestris]
MPIDLESLAALDAVVRHGGFGRAAQHLHKVQSAVSYQVRKLEEQLGLTLLDREGYRVQLTPAGEALLAEGRRLLGHADHFEALARQFTDGWEPRLLLVADGILSLDAVLSALKTLADEHVPTRVQVKIEFMFGVQYRFEKEQADLMIVKDYEPDRLLHAEPLPEIECVLCASSDHPLATAGEVDLALLHEHVELTVQDSSDRGDDRHMFGGDRVYYLSGFSSKKQALHMGLGFGWMPLYLVADELARGELVEVRYRGGSRYRFTPMLVQRLDKPLGRAGRRLAELLRAAVQQGEADGRLG